MKFNTNIVLSKTFVNFRLAGDLSAKTEEKTDQDADTQGYKRSEERRFGEDSRERRERLEEGQRGGERWERRTPSSDVMERRRKREDSEPRLAMSCDDNQDAQETLESEKSGTLLIFTLKILVDFHCEKLGTLLTVESFFL